MEVKELDVCVGGAWQWMCWGGCVMGGGEAWLPTTVLVAVAVPFVFNKAAGEPPPLLLGCKGLGLGFS